MTTQFNYNKEAADLIISKFENIPVSREMNDGAYGRGHRLYFKGSVVGCNDEGLYLEIGEGGKDFRLVMRDAEIPFSNFPFWQARRLNKFFRKKLKEHRCAVAERQDAFTQNRLNGNLNATLTELVRHGE